MKKLHKGSKHITEEIFGKIKKLLEVGLKKTQVAELTGYSWGMVHHISKLSNFQAFLDFKETERQRSLSLRHEVSSKPISAPKLPETPMYDILVEIRDEMKQLNANFVQFGKAKGFRLF